jgi:hypothetical protein
MILTSVAGVAIAADDPAAPAAEPAKPAPGTLAGVLDASGITESGYIAASYYHSNGYPSNIHQFDVQHDTFQLDQAGLTLAFQPKEGFGALVDVIAGEDARILHLAEDGHDTAIDVKQAFLQYATGPLTVIAGKYVTLAGAEVISPTGNTNFSRSLLFFNQPLTHTGIRATYAASDTVNLVLGANNGWNTTSTSYGSKTAEVGLGWTPNKIFALTAQGYFGKAEAYDAEKTLVDVVATYNATSELTFVLNYDWNQQKNAFTTATTAQTAAWSGLAAYANYAITDQWRVSLRGEYLDDKDGFLTGTEQKLKEFTVTFGYAPVKSFELRLEARYDKADTDLFTRSITGPAYYSDNLTGIAVQGLYKF